MLFRSNGYGGTRTATTPFWQNYHIFSIDWSPNLIIWRVDGSEYFRATPTSLKNAKGQDKTWVYNKGFFIILNLAVGGNFGQGNPGALPAVNQLKIDYVHVSTTP